MSDPSQQPSLPGGVSREGAPVPATGHLAGTFHDALTRLTGPWSAGVLVVGLFADASSGTVLVVPRVHVLRTLPTGDQVFDLMAWEDFTPQEVLDPAIEECGHVTDTSLMFIHVHSSITYVDKVATVGAGAQIRVRVGVMAGLTRDLLDDPVWLGRLVHDSGDIFG